MSPLTDAMIINAAVLFARPRHLAAEDARWPHGQPRDDNRLACGHRPWMLVQLDVIVRAAVILRRGYPAVQVARRRTSQMVAAISSTDSASSQPPSIHWKGQNRLLG
jgi:hypothetical protein